MRRIKEEERTAEFDQGSKSRHAESSADEREEKWNGKHFAQTSSTANF